MLFRKGVVQRGKEVLFAEEYADSTQYECQNSGREYHEPFTHSHSSHLSDFKGLAAAIHYSTVFHPSQRRGGKKDGHRSCVRPFCVEKPSAEFRRPQAAKSSGNLFFPGTCAAEKTLLSPQVCAPRACAERAASSLSKTPAFLRRNLTASSWRPRAYGRRGPADACADGGSQG